MAYNGKTKENKVCKETGKAHDLFVLLIYASNLPLRKPPSLLGFGPSAILLLLLLFDVALPLAFLAAFFEPIKLVLQIEKVRVLPS